MTSAAGAVHSAKPHGHGIGFNLGVIAVIVALGALGVAYLIDAAGRSAREARESAFVSRTVGGATLTIPTSWLSPNDSSHAGFAKQVDLVVEAPLGEKGKLVPIDLTLMPRSRVRPSAALLDGVYLHQFMPEQLSGPPGLIGKPMMATGGYAGETVWYDPINAAPFTAKCEAPLVEGGAGRCLRAVYADNNVAVVYAFDSDVLANWSRFDAVMAPILRQIGALAGE